MQEAGQGSIWCQGGLPPVKHQWLNWPQPSCTSRSFTYHTYYYFLHNRPWISPWIKSKSIELDIIIHVTVSELSGHCDVISNRLWRHQQNENWASEKRDDMLTSSFLSSFMASLCRVRNKILYVLSWRTVSALTRVFLVFISLVASQLGK